ncbi:hypothetical protein ASZ90_010047 [hydrocarbon metagenome]|uniref:Uncharacterized protein n=1 Tax=hydrocarbon metagenome TaxID=938273 RepID=A0A0W8FH32_9ZZZZ
MRSAPSILSFIAIPYRIPLFPVDIRCPEGYNEIQKGGLASGLQHRIPGRILRPCSGRRIPIRMDMRFPGGIDRAAALHPCCRYRDAEYAEGSKQHYRSVHGITPGCRLIVFITGRSVLLERAEHQRGNRKEWSAIIQVS